MLSVLELFKFVISLALAGIIAEMIKIGKPAAILAGASGILVLIRFYHGNALHILDTYAQGNRVRRGEIVMPAEALAIFLQGMFLVSLGFLLKDIYRFCCLLFGVFIVDALWLGFLSYGREEVPEGEPDYVRHWFQLSSIAALVTGLLAIARYTLPAGQGPNDDHMLGIIGIMVLAHTILDYWRAWRHYFPPTSQPISAMIGAAMSAKIVNNVWQDEALRSAIVNTERMLSENGVAVYSAHMIESFGRKLRTPDAYVREDIKRAGHCDWYIAIADGTPSAGMATEIGVAVARNAKVILCVERGSPVDSFLIQSALLSSGSTIEFQDVPDLLQQLSDRLEIRFTPAHREALSA